MTRRERRSRRSMEGKIMRHHKFRQVTVEEFKEFLAANPGREVPHLWKAQRERPWQPVVGVSAYDADAFALWSGRPLPTEKEWLADCEMPGFRREAPALYDWLSGPPGADSRAVRGGSWNSTTPWTPCAPRPATSTPRRSGPTPSGSGAPAPRPSDARTDIRRARSARTWRRSTRRAGRP